MKFKPGLVFGSALEDLYHYAKENNFDLILMGKEAIDYNSGMIHGLVAAGLNYHHFSPVMKLELIENGLELQIETDLALPENYMDAQKFAKLEADYKVVQEKKNIADKNYELMFEEIMALENKIG